MWFKLVSIGLILALDDQLKPASLVMLEDHLKPKKTTNYLRLVYDIFPAGYNYGRLLQHTHMHWSNLNSSWWEQLSLYLFSMASMFLRRMRSCQEASSFLSENRRWWLVTHRVPLSAGWKGLLRVTSSTLAVLMCSDNSISQRPPSGTSLAEFKELVGEPHESLSPQML